MHTSDYARIQMVILTTAADINSSNSRWWIELFIIGSAAMDLVYCANKCYNEKVYDLPLAMQREYVCVCVDKLSWIAYLCAQWHANGLVYALYTE